MTATTAVMFMLSVVTRDDPSAVQAAEVLARAAISLGLEGQQVTTSISTIDIEEDDE